MEAIEFQFESLLTIKLNGNSAKGRVAVCLSFYENKCLTYQIKGLKLNFNNMKSFSQNCDPFKCIYRLLKRMVQNQS